jgi:site-specific recombinase XerD
MFVAMLKTTAVVRAGAGRGRVRSPGRINYLLAAVREFYKHAVADGAVDAAVLAALYEVGDDRHLPAELRPEGSGLRYRARPRHVQRTRRSRRPVPVPVRQPEAEALLRAATCWRDRFLLVLLWFSGLRVGEALGLRRSDLHLVPSAAALGCPVPGPHVHAVGRDNPNRARAKSGDRTVPVRAEVLSCYDRYLTERAPVPAAESCDFVFVTLRHQPVGRPMSTDTVRKWLAALSVRAWLDRAVTPHMFRHSTATELLARGASIDVVKELLGHADPIDGGLPASRRRRPAGGGGPTRAPRHARDPMKPLRRVATAVTKPQAVEPLSGVLDYPLLISWGYDPVTVIFAPDANASIPPLTNRRENHRDAGDGVMDRGGHPGDRRYLRDHPETGDLGCRADRGRSTGRPRRGQHLHLTPSIY